MQDTGVPKRFSRRRLNQTNPSRRFARKNIFWITSCALIILLFFPLLQLFFGPFGVFFFDAGKLLNRQYLVLLQNEAELRPSGGFLSAFAIVRTRLGKPQITIYDSYAVATPQEKIVPPWPLEEVFSTDPKYKGWEFRDANFFADFPESAIRVLEFLQADPQFSRENFDGVIAVNLSTVESILNGSDTAEELGDSLFFRLQRETKDIDLHSPEDLKNRKNVLKELTSELMGDAGYFSLPKMASLLADSADKKNAQFWFREKSLQAKIEKKGWSGIFPDEPFFAVNITNLGAKKSDRYVRREYRSEIDIAANGEMAEAFELVMRHEGTPGLLSGEGRYLIRILRPPGTKLAGNKDGWVQQSLPQAEEFSLLMTLAPGNDLDIEADFLLPEPWQKGKRLFHWEKQSGTEDRLTVLFRGKGDVRFSAKGCDELDSRENLLFCEILLDRDTKITATLKPDTLPPIVENMLFQNDQEIFIRFSEPVLAKGTVEDFVLECPQHRLTAREIVTNPADMRDSTIVLAEVLALDGSFCTATWKGITDLSGNAKEVKMTLPRRIE